MSTLIFGKDGQVGQALQTIFRDSPDTIFLGRQDCDLSNAAALQQVLHQHNPQIIINASAYTAVDRAQTEADLALAINTQAPKLMAEHMAQQSHGVFIHYSTDYVFADTKQTPYVEEDIPGPKEQLSVYGRSKLMGEEEILEAFNLNNNSFFNPSNDRVNKSATYYILRTSWVYGDGGNFIRTMLRLAGERESLSVVADQLGAPTSAVFLANLTKQLLRAHTQCPDKTQSGIYHAVPHGYTSWHGLASYAINFAQGMGMAMKVKPESIWPIPAVSYPLPAPRPYNSRLSNAKLTQYLSMIQSGEPNPLQLNDWQSDVQEYVKEYVRGLCMHQQGSSS